MSKKFDGEPKDGLHILKDKWCQKTYFGEQSQILCDNFQEAVDATRREAPERKQGYALGRSATLKIDDSERERRWERAVFEPEKFNPFTQNVKLLADGEVFGVF